MEALVLISKFLGPFTSYSLRCRIFLPSPSATKKEGPDMAIQTITCPKCKKSFPLSAALTSRIENDIRKKYELEAKNKDKELATEYKKKLAVAEKNLQSKLAGEKAKFENEARKIAKRESASEISDLRKKLTSAKADEQKIIRRAKKEAREAFDEDLFNLQEQLDKKEEKILQMHRREAALRKQQQTLEQKEKKLDSTIKKEVKIARLEAQKELAQERDLRERQKDKQITDLTKQIKVLQRKAEQGSQQSQGEILELELEEFLRGKFPFDEIKPVAKGRRGADVLQKVCTRSGQHCGTLIWEAKNTARFSKSWLTKLKTDQRREKAEIAVLVSSVLPDEIQQFGQVQGIWITSFSLIAGVATALRENLIQASLTKAAMQGKNIEVKDMLYDYLTGNEFKLRVEAVIDSFRAMQDELEKEKRATQKNWERREDNIQSFIQSISGMYGDMQRIATLPKIKRLEQLPAASKIS